MDLTREQIRLFLHFQWELGNNAAEAATNICEAYDEGHPPYSPDLAPSDYHLFRSMEHWLRGTKFDTTIELKNSVITFLNSKNQAFYARGLDLLPDKWQEVIEIEGEYFDY